MEPALQHPANAIRSRIHEARQQSESAPALQIRPSDVHPQPTCLSAEAQAFLSKVKMPILIYGSSAHLFSTFCSTRYGVCCKLALSFTFCKTLFIQSMQQSCFRDVSVTGNRPCW